MIRSVVSYLFSCILLLGGSVATIVSVSTDAISVLAVLVLFYACVLVPRRNSSDLDPTQRSDAFKARFVEGKTALVLQGSMA